MPSHVNVGNRTIGPDESVFVIGEIGINHNGDVDLATRLIDAAVFAGCDAVKFQKRTPEICVPEDQRNKERETPWGMMTYLAYKQRIEFGPEEYGTIDDHCRRTGMMWFASPWDIPSVEFLEAFEPVAYKLASASITDMALLDAVAATGRPMFMSTGMSTMEEITAAIERLGTDRLLLAHSTSSYPCPPSELNLKMIATLRREFDCPVGYSGHEVGLQTTVAAVALGATFVERHITMNRAMWGTDQAASVEPMGLYRLVRDIRVVSDAMGDGVKKVYESEFPVRQKLRGG